MGGWFIIASAMIERAEFPVQRNSTLHVGLSAVGISGELVRVVGEEDIHAKVEQVIVHVLSHVPKACLPACFPHHLERTLREVDDHSAQKIFEAVQDDCASFCSLTDDISLVVIKLAS